MTASALTLWEISWHAELDDRSEGLRQCAYLVSAPRWLVLWDVGRWRHLPPLAIGERLAERHRRRRLYFLRSGYRIPKH